MGQVRALADLPPPPAPPSEGLLWEADGSQGLSVSWMTIWRREEIF